MGDENPIRTLGDYSKPSHEGYRNTIELPEGNNVVPLRFDTIRCSSCSYATCSKDKITSLVSIEVVPKTLSNAWKILSNALLSIMRPSRTVWKTVRSCVNIIPLYLFKKLNIGLLEETDYVFGLANGTKSYPVGIVRDVEVHIGRLKLLNNFYVIDMKKDLETPLLVGSGFLATANAVIDCRKAKIAVGEMITRNMWESEDLIENLINWDKPPKNRDRAWHAKIRLIDPDREEFTKTLQSFPTSRKLSERESPKEIINLDHIYDRK
ncbi:MAK10-like protein [Tanacetum coccineum]